MPEYLSILIVEDDPSISLVLTEVLHNEGYFNVRSVAGAEKALEVIGGMKSPCVVILDWVLPDHNGDWLLARLGKAACRVIVFTASSMRDVPKGACALVHKPCEVTGLMDAIGDAARRVKRLWPAGAVRSFR